MNGEDEADQRKRTQPKGRRGDEKVPIVRGNGGVTGTKFSICSARPESETNTTSSEDSMATRWSIATTPIVRGNVTVFGAQTVPSEQGERVSRHIARDRRSGSPLWPHAEREILRPPPTTTSSLFDWDSQHRVSEASIAFAKRLGAMQN